MTEREVAEGEVLRNRLPSSARSKSEMEATGRSNLEQDDVKLKRMTNSFANINEMPVDDISIEFFYKPHTITLLLISIAAVVYFAFVRLLFVYKILHFLSKII